MTRTAKTLSLVLAVALLVGVGFTVAAGGGAGERLASCFGHGARHGCGHPALGAMIGELDLSAEQEEQLEAIHRAAAEHRENFAGAHAALHGALVAGFEQGLVDEAELRGIVDRSLEDLRGTAYAMTGAAANLVNSLDGSQRALLEEHLEALRASAEGGKDHGCWGHGDRHGHGN